MSNPLFSILIANYNNGKYLMEAIDSVRQQTYTHWEIILVDDGSTDNSHAIYKDLEKDKRIRIFRNDKNYGCGYTKRRCADLAIGELCGFLDPDDALTPDALQIMVEQHTAHPEASTIGGCYWCCDEHMNKLWHVDQWIYSEGKCYLTDFQHLRPIPFASYKRERYLQTEGINPNIKRAVDFDLYVKLEEQGGIIFLPNITYYYRIHSQQISTHGDFKSMYWEIMVISDACKRRSLQPDEVVNDFLVHRIDYYIRNYVGQDKMPFYKRLLSKIVRKIKKILFN